MDPAKSPFELTECPMSTECANDVNGCSLPCWEGNQHLKLHDAQVMQSHIASGNDPASFLRIVRMSPAVADCTAHIHVSSHAEQAKTGNNVQALPAAAACAEQTQASGHTSWS